MKKAISIFFIIIFAISIIHADKGAVILIKGFVTDPVTGKPTGSSIKFTNKDGKVVPCKINSNVGEYQQVLQSGEKYNVSMDGYIVPVNQRNIEIPIFKEYTEYFYNFNPVKIETGMKLSEFSAFEPNSTECSVKQIEYIDDLKIFMINNKNITVNVVISSGDSFFKIKKIKESYLQGKKTKTRTKTISIQEQQQDFIDARINSLKELLIQHKIREKSLNFIADLKTAKPQKEIKAVKSKKKNTITEIPPNYNVKLIVGEIKNM